MKKLIVVSDSFKGTLSSTEIIGIAEEVVPTFFPGCEIVGIPAADGGEGTVEALLGAMHGERVRVETTGPYGEPITACYGRNGSKAVLEMASAASLPMVGERKNPALTTTYGVGTLLRHAVEHGCRELCLGIGGSATNDAGCGCAAALGVKFYDNDGRSFVPVGATLSEIARIDISAARELLREVKLSVMCDVENPLYGPQGAAYIFGPQKGADPGMVTLLDAGLRHFAAVAEAQLGVNVATLPGGGAAGGMGAGLVALLGGTLTSGIDAVLDLVDIDAQLPDADLVLTGEGRLDSQSLDGKVVSGVARRCRAAGKPLIAIVGCIGEGGERVYELGVLALFATNRAGLPFERLKARAREDYRATLRDVLSLLKI